MNNNIYVYNVEYFTLMIFSRVKMVITAACNECKVATLFWWISNDKKLLLENENTTYTQRLQGPTTSRVTAWVYS